MFSNGHSMSCSNGNSFAGGEGTERESPFWARMLAPVQDRP
jgi:hypothetical protein